MKKTLLLFTVFLGFCGTFFGAEAVSDVALFNEINLAYKNQYYPGTVDKVNQLEKAYPDSVFIQPALAYKGDALINMYRYDEAVETLNQALSNMHTGSDKMPQCTYLLGKAYYYQNDFKQALENLHKACSLALTDKNMEFYNPSVLYSAKIYYKLEKYDQAYPLYEYVIRNGQNYSAGDYNEALQKIMLSYNKANRSEKTVALFNQLNKSDFNDELYYTLQLYNADAKKNLNKNKEAYDEYCKVIECPYEYLAVIALKKAYTLASEKNIGVNPGEVFSKTVDTFKENPSLVNEFWTRLGIDEYKNKNYKKAEEYFANVTADSKIITLYRSKILLDRDKKPASAEALLLTIEPEDDLTDFPNFNDSYYSVLLQCKLQQKKWQEIEEAYSKIKQPDNAAVYALSASYYEQEQYAKVSPKAGSLYPSALGKMGNYAAAVNAFEKLELTAEEKAEYAKALFACGRYSEAFSEAQQSTDKHKDYISGLCLINQKNWSMSQTYFANYIKSMSGKADFNSLAFWYKGYAEYCLEQYKNAYASFVRFGLESDRSQIKYARKGYEYAAKSALQNGDFKNASIQAENVIKTSTSEKEKQDAVIFCADILSDYENYDKAIDVLQPYTGQKNDFAVQALFNTARIYEKKGDVKTADSYYQTIYKDYPNSDLAEEAMYRTGEVYYSCGDYGTALNRFNAYIYRHVSGKFSDAALFFGGDSALKLGELDRAVLLNTTMLSKFPDSVYSYGANKNLLSAYYDQENYNQALNVAKVMVKNYPEQSANDEIGGRLIELEKIVSGTDVQVAQKQSEYENLGKSSSKKGRVAGSELVKLYSQNAGSQKEAFDLAMELLPKQTAADERKYAAENAEFIADYYRKDSQNKKAAEIYLKAAEYYRGLDNSSRAAASLYGAAEAFMADGLEGDARETAKLLKELYPESRQAERVEGIF